MDPKHLFIDERLKGKCIYCGGPPETVEHVPSRVFLDNPLPENLPVVEACQKCNAGFSYNEEYLACLLECVMTGTTEVEGITREKIKRSLSRNTRLKLQLDKCRKVDDAGQVWWEPEDARVRNIVIKLAQGHAAYELAESLDDKPDVYSVHPIPTMSTEEKEDFEKIGDEFQYLWPEIGSRAFLRISGKTIFPAKTGDWMIIQPVRYRYAIDWQAGIDVRIVLGEYLACRVVWG